MFSVSHYASQQEPYFWTVHMSIGTAMSLVPKGMLYSSATSAKTLLPGQVDPLCESAWSNSWTLENPQALQDSSLHGVSFLYFVCHRISDSLLFKTLQTPWSTRTWPDWDRWNTNLCLNTIHIITVGGSELLPPLSRPLDSKVKLKIVILNDATYISSLNVLCLGNIWLFISDLSSSVD